MAMLTWAPSEPSPQKGGFPRGPKGASPGFRDRLLRSAVNGIMGYAGNRDTLGYAGVRWGTLPVDGVVGGE